MNPRVLCEKRILVGARALMRWMLGVGLLLVTVPGTATQAEGPALDVSGNLRLRLEQPSAAGSMVVAGEALSSIAALRGLYETRHFQPAWVRGTDLRTVNDLVSALEEAPSHGLRAKDYHLPAIKRLRRLSRLAPSPGTLGDLDLLLTDAFLTYGSHLASGRVDPETRDTRPSAQPSEIALDHLALRAAASGRPAAELRELLPTDPGYQKLRKALADFRTAPAWHVPSPGPTLRRGDVSARVAEIRSRLSLPARTEDEASVFDAELEAAVQKFQGRMGLAADGVVGRKTLAAMRVTREQRRDQIAVNLERWRWLPRRLGPAYVLVNVPEFVLRAVDGDRVVLEMAVVVGRDARRTPVLSDEIEYLVLNPFWEIPPSLAVSDQLPKIREDPDYLARSRIRVLQGWWGSEEREIDPASVNWQELGLDHFPYRLRQDPGPQNLLGRVKFMFPNPYFVYLHDTPARELFSRPARDASSGCVRIERPLDLAEWMLRGSGWTREKLEAAIASGLTHSIPLPHEIPVYLQYWTAWVGEDAQVSFRNDLYGRDAAIAEALGLSSLREQAP